MTPERWKRIGELFDQALERAPQERGAWLREQCAGEDALRGEVEKLLAADARAAGIVEEAVGDELRSLGPASRRVGQRLGPYEILSELGRGGMGTVYLARRDDDVFRKEVAIKMVHGGAHTEQILKRFRRERQILARLEHPYIARVIDGGSSPDGLPYLVMEYVSGRPLTAYCRERRLSVGECLALFRKVCEAVQYAHQNLVVHRDLKPSNILVDESGSPKLLDFGIAKLLVDEEAASASVTHTSRMLTPQYASPEQVKAEPITTASDIYSLGAVFYEALTWGPAHRVTTNSPAAWVRAVCDQKPLPPSVAAAECGSPLQFSLDLDKILLRAMQKDPRLRYESAGELSEDLRRYLEHLPVTAQSPTFRYRAGKFLRRNRVSAAAAALVVLSLLGTLSLALYQARRAERRFQEVRRLARTFLFDIHEQLQPLPGSTVVQESVVRTSLQYLDNLARESTGDTSLLFELASAYQKIGDVQGYAALPNLGHAEAALQSHRKALELARQLVERDPSPPARRLLVRAHQRVAYLLTGEGELAAAMEHDREASRLGEELYAAAPGNPEDSRLLMNVYHLAGTQQLRQGDAAAARRSWQRQMEIAQQFAAAHPGDESLSALGFAHRYMSRALQAFGDLEGALRHARESVAAREAVAAGKGGNTALLRELLNGYEETAYVAGLPDLPNLGDYHMATTYARKVIALAEQLAAADPHNARARSDLGIAYSNACALFVPLDPAAAREWCRKALEIYPPSRPGAYRYTLTLWYQARVWRKLGQPARARDSLRAAIAALANPARPDRMQAETRRVLLRAHNEMGAALVDLREPAAALEHHREALAIAETIVAERPSDLVARRDLAECYEGLGRADRRPQACDWYRQSLDIWSRWATWGVSSVYDTERRKQAQQRLDRCLAWAHQ